MLSTKRFYKKKEKKEFLRQIYGVAYLLFFGKELTRNNHSLVIKVRHPVLYDKEHFIARI